MTTKTLEAIERMNKAGMNDRWIAEELGIEHTIISYWRRKLGLPKVGINRTKRYMVYKGDQFIMEGTSRECAARLGIKKQSFLKNKMLFDRGKFNKYEIYEVEA